MYTAKDRPKAFMGEVRIPTVAVAYYNSFVGLLENSAVPSMLRAR
jgi:hypothetical protein